MSAPGQTPVPDDVRWEQALHVARSVPLPQRPRWPGGGLRRAVVLGSLSLGGCAIVAAALTHVLPDHAYGWGGPGRSTGPGRALVAVAAAVLGMVPVVMGAVLMAIDAPWRWSRPWPPSVLTSEQRRSLRRQVRREVALDQRLLPLALHVAQRAAPSDGLLVMFGGLALGQAGIMAQHTGWFALVPAVSSAVLVVVVVLVLVWGRGSRQFLADHAPPAPAAAAGGHDLRASGGGLRRLHLEGGP